MGERTSISWADHTYNPWVGCAPVSPGCQHCYARAFGARLGVQWGEGRPRRSAAASTLAAPLRWNRAAVRTGTRPRVFCGSLMDWLDPEVPVGWLHDLLHTIATTPHLDWLLLTKRPEFWRGRLEAVARSVYPPELVLRWLLDVAPPHVWLGASVEDQERADERIPALMEIPVRIRFLSCEPLLGPLDLGEWLLGGPDWLLLGGESGPGARPCNQAWIRSLIAQGRDAHVPVWVKQLGANSTHMVPTPHGLEPVGTRWRDRKGADPSEWPEDLRVQEVPA